jgi:spermidine synthase
VSPSGFDEGADIVISPTRHAACLYLLVFLSGIAALIYEISWTRQIGVLFGHTTEVASLVLSSYFLGMAGGYALGGRWSQRIRPLIGYAVCEAVVAGWACVIPLLLALADGGGLRPWLQTEPGPWQLLSRGTFVVLLLGPATCALGATLPFLAEHFSRDAQSSSRIAVAYAWNTIGALVGVITTAAVLLVYVGAQSCSILAAGISASCACVAWGLRSRSEVECREPIPRKVANPPDQSPNLLSTSEIRLATLFAAFSGFGTLALEVLYTRMFSLVLHNSTHTFAIVIAIFLLGLALGSLLSSWLVQRFDATKVIHTAAALGGLLIPMSVMWFVGSTRLEYFPLGNSFVGYLRRVAGITTVVILPAATALGIILPATWHLLNHNQQKAGRGVGNLTMINTLASAAGSLGASFAFLPGVGLWMSFGVISVLFAVLPVLQGVRTRCWRWLILGAGGCVLTVPLWSGTTRGPLIETWMTPLPHEQLLRRWETDYGWVDVTRDDRDGALRIRQNRHYSYGSTGEDTSREQRQAHLPLLLHPHPKEVLCLGLGTGLTAAGTLPHPEVQRTTVLELIPEVVDAARMLSAGNGGVVDHPKVDLHIDDARHYLATTDRQFDVIVADLFVPWESTTGYLYTVEHYQAAQGRLRPGGVFCQWLALYQVSPREFELIADSMAEVFPHTTLWWGHLSSNRPIVALIGGATPLLISGPDVDARLNRLKDSGQFADPLLTDSASIYELWLGDWPRHSGVTLNTNEHPRVEFLAPIAHGDHTLLRRESLKQYYDAILARLPRANVHFKSAEGRPLPRNVPWQRTILFPD